VALSSFAFSFPPLRFSASKPPTSLIFILRCLQRLYAFYPRTFSHSGALRFHFSDLPSLCFADRSRLTTTLTTHSKPAFRCGFLPPPDDLIPPPPPPGFIFSCRLPAITPEDTSSSLIRARWPAAMSDITPLSHPLLFYSGFCTDHLASSGVPPLNLRHFAFLLCVFPSPLEGIRFPVFPLSTIGRFRLDLPSKAVPSLNIWIVGVSPVTTVWTFSFVSFK